MNWFFLLLLFIIMISLKLPVHSFKIEQMSTVWYRILLYMIWLKSLVLLTFATYILNQPHQIKASERISAIHDLINHFSPPNQKDILVKSCHTEEIHHESPITYKNHKIPLLCENVLFTDWYNGKMTETTVVFLAPNTWNCSLVTNNPLMYSLARKNWIHTRGR